MLYTILLISIFRIAATITIPIVKVNQDLVENSNSLIGMLNLIGGGALSNFSIVALGISPYITASIIMTLLQSEAFPAIYRLAHSGPVGKRKIAFTTRILTICFAIVQAMTVIQQFRISQHVELLSPADNVWYQYLVIPLILLAGSLFSLFLGEQITSRGAGNGISLIIFSGIAADLPAKIQLAYSYFVSTSQGGSFVGGMNFIVHFSIFAGLIFIVTFFHKAERHIPTQQTGSGLTRDVKQMSHLPMKVNPAGVMPVIFAMTILLLPLTITGFLHHQDPARQWIENHLRLTDPLGLGIFILIIFVFSIVMSLITFNPYTVTENFKKSGTFIPGIRPGQETEKYLTGIVMRLSVFSGFYLSIISSVPFIEQMLGIPQPFTISGTSLIILVSVAIETLEHVRARDTTQTISRAREQVLKTIDSEDGKSGGLLW
ncbi:preprotein translocase subunit SecY [Mycoplasma sp. ATU-Cv-508]|uniref:preprotein translocase subunit SecY n=1 Tax=Mycoplasma sp. ATU-Cv-508 TaxID=2048001 RepID=UPI0031F326BC